MKNEFEKLAEVFSRNIALLREHGPNAAGAKELAQQTHQQIMRTRAVLLGDLDTQLATLAEAEAEVRKYL